MKTDFVREEDEEAKENEPRLRDVKKQEDELGRRRQDATARYGQFPGERQAVCQARYGLLPGETKTGCHGTLRTTSWGKAGSLPGTLRTASWGKADRMPRHTTDCFLGKGRQDATARYGLLPWERQTGCHGTLRTMRDGRLSQRCAEHSGLGRCVAVNTKFRTITVPSSKRIHKFYKNFFYISGHNCSNDKSVRLYN